MIKKCTRCDRFLPLDNFHKNSRSKDGLQSWCKDCFKQTNSDYYKTNKDAIRTTHMEYYNKNREHIREVAKIYQSSEAGKAKKSQYYQKNKKLILGYQKRYRKENQERIKVRSREYQRNNKDKVAQWHKKYRDTHRAQLHKASRRYREENREKINTAHLNRLHTDINYKMKEQVRNMLRTAFRGKGHRKKSKTKDIVGCDLDSLCEYLLSTWEKNYNRAWGGEPCHIDHIVPLATAKTADDIIRLCHYTNLQLLTPEDNMKKGATTTSTHDSESQLVASD